MPLTIEEHLDNIDRHIGLVRDGTVLLGKRFIKRDEKEFGMALIARGFRHDNSKFAGIEFDYLHAGSDVPKDMLIIAVRQHCLTNDHHPEFWGGIDKMPPLCLAEMVCDWYARSQEFGTSLRDWIEKEAVDKYKISPMRKAEIDQYVNMLLVDHFVR